MSDEKDAPFAGLDISAQQATQPVRIHLRNGETIDGLLVEMMSDQVAEWRKHEMQCMVGAGGAPSLAKADLRGFQEKLISLCLHDPTGQTPVPHKTIMGWQLPSKALHILFTACQTMNGLNEEGREQAKKG